MMRSSIAVAAAVLLLIAVAGFFGPAVDADCPKQTPMQNYNISEILERTWYKLYISESDEAVDSKVKCITETTYAIDNGAYAREVTSKSSNGDNTTQYRVEQVEKEGTLNLKAADKAKTLVFTETYLGTDYDYYAVRVACNVQASTYRFEVLSVQQEIDDEGELPDDVTELLNSTKLPYKLVVIDQDNC